MCIDLQPTMETIVSQYLRSNVAVGRNALEGVQRWRGTYTEGRHPHRGGHLVVVHSQAETEQLPGIWTYGMAEPALNSS